MTDSRLSFHYEKKFEVLSFQIDPQGQLRWGALGDLLQEIAWKHADSKDFGQSLFDQGFHWVLSRMSILVRKLPAWGDVITVKTAGRGINKLFALREFLVEDSDGNPLVTAMSAWLLLDSGSKRPKRPNQILPAELFPPQAEFELLPEKLVIPSTAHKSQGFLVRPSDLDMNNHVNNVSYIRWIEDYCSFSGIQFKELEINYLAEALLNESVDICMAEEEDKRIILTGSIEDKSVFIARITPR